ncbi:alpha/beta fold hydrolase [Streptomyces sp. SID8379]|uniref:esterase/lipase family protein n=1 Tax=unclassified Streptomyces TaxID=2593676 RepID=UPI00035F4B07|nr:MULTISPECIES: alpha/beta fold hydrolase [unclassified Streptomyces]MYW67011.1 alpha/beta fold hydrolase [Streptomyces sp. SID8379]
MSFPSVLRSAAVTVIAAALFLGPAAEADAATSADPVPAAKKLATPGLPGVNDWSCTPSAAHPRPVILVHGTFATGQVWKETATAYKKAGYCVFALDYGRTGGLLSLFVGGVGRIAGSAEQLGVFVDGVLAATGARQVDLVGHSQGGMMPRQYMKFEGGADAVHTLVGISPSNHGTGRSDLAPALGALVDVPCPACTDQIHGSSFLRKLNAGGDTLPGTSYTVIVTAKDKVVVPPTSQFLTGANVDNILLQDVCPANGAQHSDSLSDPVATRLALNALDPEHAVKPACPLG